MFFEQFLLIHFSIFLYLVVIWLNLKLVSDESNVKFTKYYLHLASGPTFYPNWIISFSRSAFWPFALAALRAPKAKLIIHYSISAVIIQSKVWSRDESHFARRRNSIYITQTCRTGWARKAKSIVAAAATHTYPWLCSSCESFIKRTWYEWGRYINKEALYWCNILLLFL